MIEVIQSATFRKWLDKLPDRRARTLIVSRINRLSHGALGDTSPVGEGVSELRMHFGPGYRVYYCHGGLKIVLLLCGGDKGSQKRDVQLAKRLARQWRQTND